MRRKNITNEIICESIMEALTLLMEKKPFDEITITELTEKAGVARVSFYRNFKSKEDVLLQKLDDAANDWWADMSGMGNQNYALELVKHGIKIKNFLLLLYRHNLSHLLLQNVWNCCGPKPDNNAEGAYTNAVLSGAIYGLCDEWIRRGMKESPEEVAEYFHGLDKLLVQSAAKENEG